MSTMSRSNPDTIVTINEDQGRMDRVLEEGEEEDQQQTQNIFFRFHGGPRETSSPTSAPTAVPLNRDYNFRACLDDATTTATTRSATTLAGVADVHFVYDIETTNELTRVEERKMLNALETAMIDSIFSSVCSGGGGKRQRQQIRRLLGSDVSKQRRLEIHSISSGNRDKVNGDCIVTTDEATVCSRYDGSIKVGYTDTGDDNNEVKAGNTALRIVSMDMNQDVYLDVMNSALGVEIQQELNSTEVGNSTIMVKRVSYVGTSFYDVTRTSEISGLTAGDVAVQDDSTSLTTLGKIFVPVMVVLFLGVILVMYLAYRKRQRNQRLARLAVLRAKEDNLYQRRHDRPYRDPFDADVRDVGVRAINQDVHRCNKTNCVACMQQLPVQLEEMTAKRKLEDYAHPKVEVVDLDEGGESESVFSGLTGGPKTVGSSVWSAFGRKPQHSGTKQPKIHVDESVDDSLDRFLDKFYDEPRAVTFVKINHSMSDSLDEQESNATPNDFSIPSEDYHGTRSKIIDHTGQIRNQLEL